MDPSSELSSVPGTTRPSTPELRGALTAQSFLRPRGLAVLLAPSRKGEGERVLPRSTDLQWKKRGESGLPQVLPRPAKGV